MAQHVLPHMQPHQGAASTAHITAPTHHIRASGRSCLPATTPRGHCSVLTSNRCAQVQQKRRRQSAKSRVFLRVSAACCRKKSSTLNSRNAETRSFLHFGGAFSAFCPRLPAKPCKNAMASLRKPRAAQRAVYLWPRIAVMSMAARSAGPLRRLAEPHKNTLRCLALTQGALLATSARKASVNRTARSTWRAACTSHAALGQPSTCAPATEPGPLQLDCL